MQNDEELMRAYQEGSEQAFNELYSRYSSMVYSFVRRRLRTSEVDDFYQKVWRQLHEKRHLYQGQPFAPWFFVVIKNLLIDEYRALGRQNTQELKEDLLNAIHAKSEDGGPDLEELLSRLPPESAELVRKYYLQEISYEELSRETGLSQTNLRQRLSRAMKGLRSKSLYEK